MIYKPNSAFYDEFSTSKPSTGEAQDADSLPTVTVTKNGTDDASFVLTATKIDTGRYKITGTVPIGYVSGDRFQVSVAATVDTVSGKAVIGNYLVDTSYSSDNYSLLGSPVALDGGAATISGMLTKMADDNGGADFDATTDSLEKIQTKVAESTPHQYYPATATRTIGSDQGGVAGDLAAHDAVYFATGEDLTLGLQVDISISTPIAEYMQKITVPGYYSGSASHFVTCKVYNYLASTYETKFTMLSRTSAFDYEAGLTSDHRNAITGEVLIRFEHSAGTYNPAHRLYLDMVQITKSESLSTIAADIATIVASTGAIQAGMGDPSADTTTLYEQLTTLIDRLTALRAGYLDNLSAGPVALEATVTNATYGLNAIKTIVDAIPSDVWDEVLTKETHNIANSAGKRVRQITADIIVDGTAVSATENSITLDTNASTIAGTYDPSSISIVAGTGAGQTRLILEYMGTPRKAWVDRDWKVIPNSTSEYIIWGHPGREHVNEGVIEGIDVTKKIVTLNSNASPIDGAYNGQTFFVRSGTGEDQAKKIVGYVGATRQATMCDAFDVTLDTTSCYVILPTGLLRGDILAESLMNNGLAKESTLNSGILAISGSDGSNLTNIGDDRMAHMLNISGGPVATEADMTSVVSTLNDMETKILAMYELYGLDPNKPLSVSLSERRAGTIVQTIVSDSNNQTTTVTRIA